MSKEHKLWANHIESGITDRLLKVLARDPENINRVVDLNKELEAFSQHRDERSAGLDSWMRTVDEQRATVQDMVKERTQRNKIQDKANEYV